jgi:hypothetical protein
MPNEYLVRHKQSLLAPDPLRRKELYTTVNRAKLSMDPKAMFLCNPPDTPQDVSFYVDPYVVDGYILNRDDYVTYLPL